MEYGEERNIYRVEKIQIIVNRDTPQEEISDLEKIANSCELKKYHVENSGGRRFIAADFPPELIILISIPAGMIAAGFFGGIGHDLWQKIKQFSNKAFKYYEDAGEPIYNPQIYIDIRVAGNSKIQVNFPNQNFHEFEEALEALDSFIQKHSIENFSSLEYSGGEWVISNKKFKNQEESYHEFIIEDYKQSHRYRRIFKFVFQLLQKKKKRAE